MKQVAGGIEVLFLHGQGEATTVSAIRDHDHLFTGRLRLGSTEAGPRPKTFEVIEGSASERRPPDQFVELARRAEYIRISEQTPPKQRDRLETMLAGYQLEAEAVRTCRFCADDGVFSPLTEDNAINSDGESICLSCAKGELERHTGIGGHLSSRARDRLGDLLAEVQDLDRIRSLFSDELDPDVTRVDEISATVDTVDPIGVEELDLDPRLKTILSDSFDTLLPVQSLAVEHGLLDGTDQLVVSATATGKTLVGELAGINRALRGEGTLLFLVPLVALANQTYDDFEREYGEMLSISLRVGGSRIDSGGAAFDPTADVIVGTYEGIDHALRVGHDLGDIGTVVIDEVHTLTEDDRGHRLDGLIARLHYYCRQQTAGETQWLYLSATVGNPSELAGNLKANLVEFEERPVPIERHLTFADQHEKPAVADKLVSREFNRTSSKGYRGQTIIFTHSRRRCHEISRRLSASSAPYHAGLDNSKRRSVERQFGNQDIAAVVTTAALAAGVDFPASQVIFDSLAMGIEWLTVQEFEQMLGRAGRPDYHDRGVVYLLVEPDGIYHRGQESSEDARAFALLEGHMDDVITEYSLSVQAMETLANIVVAGAQAKGLNEQMIGEIDTTAAVAHLLEAGFIDGLAATPLGAVATRHFLTRAETERIIEEIAAGTPPKTLVGKLELAADDG